VSAEDGRQEPGKPLHSFGKLGVQYTVPALSVTADIDVVNGPTLFASALVNRYSFSGGFDLQYNTHIEEKDLTPEVVDVNLGLAYRGPGWSAFTRTTESLTNLRGGYLHSVTEKVDVAALFDYRLKTNYQKLTLGASWT
jgi:hypothetical protein